MPQYHWYTGLEVVMSIQDSEVIQLQSAVT